MVKEWSTGNEFNSFNSWKGLTYKPWYDAILAGKFLPPIECSVDPVNACNLNCIWCNGRDVKSRNKRMDFFHLLELVRFFKKWGVKAVCFAGGGEPTLFPMLHEIVNECAKLDLPSAIITNGTFPCYENDLHTFALAKHCRWIGVSVDAATAKTYEKLKKVNLFDKVLDNIKILTTLGAREVTYKFLLHPENQYEVYKAIELARDLGCHKIHIRPVSFMNFQEEEEKFDIESIDEQVLKGRGIYENEKFNIFYVRHKFDKDMHRKFGFTKCQATPIMPIFQADNSISLCIDRKADKSMIIGSHEDVSEIPKIWGGEKHKQVIENIKLSECPKCTLNAYQSQIEHMEKLDWMFT